MLTRSELSARLREDLGLRVVGLAAGAGTALALYLRSGGQYGMALFGGTVLILFVPLLVETNRALRLAVTLCWTGFSIAGLVLLVPPEYLWLELLVLSVGIAVMYGGAAFLLGVRPIDFGPLRKSGPLARFVSVAGSRLLQGAAFGAFFGSMAAHTDMGAHVSDSLAFVLGSAFGIYGVAEWALTQIEPRNDA